MKNHRKEEQKEHPVFQKARSSQTPALFTFFVLIGISILFISLMVMFALHQPARHLGGMHFPKLFFLSTPVILLCSYFIERTKIAFRNDDASGLLRFQMYTLLTSLVFGILQYFGWVQLWESGILFSSVRNETGEVATGGGGYLYLLSGLHLVHLLGGLVFLFSMMFRVVEARADMVKSVVYFSDKREQSRISSLALYWHFLGVLWVILFLYFLWFFV